MAFSKWNQWLRRSFRVSQPHRPRTNRLGKARFTPRLELLEDRTLLSASSYPHLIVRPDHIVHSKGGSSPALTGSPSPFGLTPAQVRHAYGIDLINFGGIVGDGTGQTIAIVDAYDDPNFVSTGAPNFGNSDLHQFDLQFGLPDPPNFTKVAADGSNNYPTPDPGNPDANPPAPPGGWETEEALDIEWAHAVAPRADILEVEADSSSTEDLSDAIDYARNVPNVTVVSMSFTGGGYDDSQFVTPNNHLGVTFVAATGDIGGQTDFPALSHNVVAVGGTNLSLNPDNTWQGEVGWSSSGGGINVLDLLPGGAGEPAWQLGVQQSGARTVPDVAFDAGTGVAVFDSFNFGGQTPWISVTGTSLATPCWAGLIAIADEGRFFAGMGTLDGGSQTLPALYALPACDFHDIVSGGNSTFAAGPGYDLVTGIGTPIANLLVPDLAGVPGELSYVATQSNSPNNLMLSLDQGTDLLELFDNGFLVACKPLANTSDVHVIGAANTNNKLTVVCPLGAFLPPVTFDGPGTNDLVVDDSANPYPEAVTLTNQSITATGELAGWTVNYHGSSLNSLAVTIGNAYDPVNILSTSVKTHLETGAGFDPITVGNAGSVQGIKGDLSIETTQFALTTNSLTVDDSADHVKRYPILNTFTPNLDSDWGIIDGLAPASISYENIDLSSVAILTGRNSDTTVLQIDAPTLLIGGSGQEEVHVGTIGSTEFIQGRLTIKNLSGSTRLFVDDSSDNTDHTSLTLSKYEAFIGGTFGSITGLAPAEIDYAYASTSSLRIYLGSGTIVADILATGVQTSLYPGASTATVQVGNAGSMQDIAGTLSLSSSDIPPSGQSTLTLDDSAYPKGRTITISHHPTKTPGLAYDKVSGMAPADIYYTDSVLASVNVVAGKGKDTVNVQSMGVPIYLDSGGGQDTVLVGDQGSVQGINAPLAVENSAAHNSRLTVDDSADTTDRTVTLSTADDPHFGSITGLAPAEIDYEYSDLALLTIRTGNANVTLNVLATGVATGLDTAESNATILVGDHGNAQNINGNLLIYESHFPAVPHVTTLTVDDSADASGTRATLYRTGKIYPNAPQYEVITGLAPATVSYESTAIASATIDGGTGGNAFDILNIVSGPPVLLNSGAGNDTIVLFNPDGIAAPLTLTAGAGTDTLYVFDQAVQTGITYNINATGITRNGSATIAYDGSLENVIVDGGNHGNTFNVAPSTATTFFINGGSNSDVLNVDLTGVTAPDLMFTTPTSGEWVFGNRQPIQFTSIGQVAPADALPYVEDFADGIADHFIAREGLWTPGGGHYGAMAAVGGDAVSTLLLSAPLPSTVVASAAISMNPAAGGYDSNGFLIFDYHSPTDFKYAGARQSTGEWVIGQRTATGWHDVAVLTDTIAVDLSYDMNVLLAGNRVTLEVNGSVKVVFDFANPVNSGVVGLGTENSISQFALVQVQVPG